MFKYIIQLYYIKVPVQLPSLLTQIVIYIRSEKIHIKNLCKIYLYRDMLQ